jgi:hypothetical protein
MTEFRQAQTYALLKYRAPLIANFGIQFVQYVIIDGFRILKRLFEMHYYPSGVSRRQEAWGPN